MTEPTPQPTVTPSSPLTLAMVMALGALAAVVGKVLVERFGGSPPVPVSVAVWTALLAIATAGFAARARRRIHRDPEPVAPEEATRWLALGKTGAFVGALFAGAFAAYAIATLPRVDTAVGGPRVWWSVAAAVTSLGWLAAGVALERACRIPPGGDESGRPGK